MLAKFKTELLTNEDIAKLAPEKENCAGAVRFTNRKGNVLYVTVSTNHQIGSVDFSLYNKDFDEVGTSRVHVTYDNLCFSVESKLKETAKILFQAGSKLPSDTIGKKLYRKAAWRIAANAKKMEKAEKKRKKLSYKKARENRLDFQAVKKFFGRL